MALQTLSGWQRARFRLAEASGALWHRSAGPCYTVTGTPQQSSLMHAGGASSLLWSFRVVSIRAGRCIRWLAASSAWLLHAGAPSSITSLDLVLHALTQPSVQRFEVLHNGMPELQRREWKLS